MLFLYNLLVLFVSQLLKILAVFSPKIKLFVDGRKSVFEQLENNISQTDTTIWFHAASLGEFEQGLPVMEKIKEQFPNHKIVVTFFSPSGYEVRKNNSIADVTVYLPLDTKSNAKRFLATINPEMVFFIKYEYWPNYLNELRKRQTKTYLISGIFREKQVFFQWYGRFYRNALKTFGYFFVQNESSKLLLQKIGYQNVKVSGDTRFDRVVSILELDSTLDFIAEFKNNQTLIVAGSTWAKDEVFLINFINNVPKNVKFIIAPHNINKEQISNLKSQISKKTILFSDLQTNHVRTSRDLSVRDLSLQYLQEYDIFIIDTIGILTKIYSYGDIAYVGGGFGTAGLHNILEPATFGMPIVIGPNYSNFAEAIALVHLEGCVSVANQEEFNETFDLLIQNEDERFEKGHICTTFIQMNKGATDVILKHVLNETLN
jgi:3-deoxy-D-manno-octulosonic-acid transferase